MAMTTDQSSPEGGENMPTCPKPVSDELAAMIADLGLERVEELAKDEGGISASRPSVQSAQTLPSRPTGPSNPLASAYHDAIQQGAFDDDDSRAVRDLDPLDGGNAHRLNRSRQPDRGNERSAPGFARRIQRYDPFNPGFRSRARPSTMAKKPDGNQGVGSLGGIIPPGGAVKRWGHDQPGGLAKHPFQLSTSTKSPITVKKALSDGDTSKTYIPTENTPSPSRLPLTGIASTGDVANSQKPPRAPGSKDANTVTQPPPLENPATTSSDLDGKTQKDQAEGNNAWKKTAYPSREIFFEAECVKVTGPPIPSWVCIYELSDKSICLCELHTMDGSVVHEEISHLLEPRINGQNVSLYRKSKSGPDDAPCANILLFDSEKLAKSFAEEVQQRILQFAEPGDPIDIGHIDSPMQNCGIYTDTPEEEDTKSNGNSTSSPIMSTEQVISEAIPNQSILSSHQAPEEESLISIGGDESTELQSLAPATAYGGYHEDLDGLQYGIPAMNTLEGYDANESEMRPGENHEGVYLRYAVICPDIKSINAVPVGVGLSMESQSILSRVKSEEYREMIRSCKMLANVVNEVMSASKDSPAATFVAAQLATLHLDRDQGFRALPKSEQDRATAVVYRNILHGLSQRITWTPQELLSFRPSQKAPCPKEVSEVNAMNKKWWEKRQATPPFQPLPYSPAMFQKNAEQNTEFLYGNRHQGDAILASTSGSRECESNQPATLTSDSLPNSPQVTSTTQSLPRPQSPRVPSGLYREEYVTSSYTVAAQRPEWASYVPRNIAPENTQTQTSRSSSKCSSQTGLAASRWNSPQMTPQIASHRQEGSNASTRSTISRLAHDMASL
ncbi:hypothetical protein F4775DRAFT_603959 [Biscogniauxia sp. FL1348]|nr:hypothetical protein F4775DRAFT_603959 [Biscogniauxia sp. FL1348]